MAHHDACSPSTEKHVHLGAHQTGRPMVLGRSILAGFVPVS